MKKKILSLLLATTLLLCSCGSSEDNKKDVSKKDKSTQKEVSSEKESQEAEEKDEDVTLYFVYASLGNETEEELLAQARETFPNAEPYNSEYYQVKMKDSERKAKKKEFLKEYNEKDLIDSFEDDNIQKIEVNDSYTEVKIYVTDEDINFNTYFASAIMFGIIADFVQGCDMVDIEDRDLTIQFVDYATGKVIDELGDD